MEQAGLRIPFECITRAERVDEAVAAALVRLGCVRVWIGSESGSQRVLNAMDRRVSVETVQRSTALLKSKGIEVGFFIMLGYEGETEADIAATVRHIRESGPDVVLTTTSYPIRGTGYAADLGARALNAKPWAETSDRETTVAGRPSLAYYRAACSWVENDAAAHRALRAGRYLTALRATARAQAARFRMKAERGTAAS